LYNFVGRSNVQKEIKRLRFCQLQALCGLQILYVLYVKLALERAVERLTDCVWL